MPKFSTTSQRRLATCHPVLQDLFEAIVKVYDCSIICGQRNEIEQNKAFNSGRSSKRYPFSKHNGNPSMGVDVAPWPIDWDDADRFYHFGGFVRGFAHSRGIKIRWGGDWDADFDLKDQTFFDLVHFELVEAPKEKQPDKDSNHTERRRPFGSRAPLVPSAEPSNPSGMISDIPGK